MLIFQCPKTPLKIMAKQLITKQQNDETTKRQNDETTKRQKPHSDRVNHPSHYTWLKDICGIEVIDIARHMDFDLGNAVKYILRAGHKHEEGYTELDKRIEDLQKAVFYLNDEIQTIIKQRDALLSE